MGRYNRDPRGGYADMTFQKITIKSRSFQILSYIAHLNIEGIKPTRKHLIETFGPKGASRGWYSCWFSDAMTLNIISSGKDGYIVLSKGYDAMTKAVSKVTK